VGLETMKHIVADLVALGIALFCLGFSTSVLYSLWRMGL